MNIGFLSRMENESRLVVGAEVANNALLSAVVRQDDFENVHVFSDSLAMETALSELRSRQNIDQKYCKVQVIDIADVYRTGLERDYLVFHQGNMLLGILSCFRKLSRQDKVPITGYYMLEITRSSIPTYCQCYRTTSVLTIPSFVRPKPHEKHSFH